MDLDSSLIILLSDDDDKKDQKKKKSTKNKRAEKSRARAMNFTFELFDKKVTKFSRWIERLESNFKVSKITEEDQKHGLLIRYMGQEAYDVLCDQIAPTKASTKKYEEIKEILEQFYDPAPLEIVEIFKFHSRKQSPSENINEYMVELRKIAVNCNFGTYLSNALRNQLVLGVHSHKIQQALLQKKELVLTKAMEIALAIESSEKGGAELDIPKSEVCHIQQQSRRKKSNKHPNSKKSCYRCGSETHSAPSCNFINAECLYCHKKGHIKRVCLAAKAKNSTTSKKKTQNNSNSKKTESETANLIEDENRFSNFWLNSSVLDPSDELAHISEKNSLEKIWLALIVEGIDLKMEVDTGSPVSIISNNDRIKYFPGLHLSKNNRNLVSYCGGKINILGILEVKVSLGGNGGRLPLYVSDSDRSPILGREWMGKINMNWNKVIQAGFNEIKEVNLIQKESIPAEIKSLMKEFSSVFENSLGKIKGIKARITLKPNATPIFLKARSTAFSMKPLIENEIKLLVKQGALIKVDRSEWATPIVAVKKSNNRVRICGDYKLTVNPQLCTEEHPLPTVNEMFSDLAGGEEFSKVDLEQAYMQLEVENVDQEILTLNTPWGLFKPTRLLPGVGSAVAIFQRKMTALFSGIPGVSVFLDDVKITGRTRAAHLKSLREVLRRLHLYNMRVNLDKCEFFAKSIEYCGYLIDKNGIHKIKRKVEAIQNMPPPANKDQVRSFVGMVNYYGCFIKDLSTILYPINNLLKENVSFKWSVNCENSFKRIKEEMQSDNFLVHYDPNLPLILATDSSPFGVGAVLSHKFPNGLEKPILFASQTLNPTQQKYSQIDREAYAIIFGVKKFYQYLYGRKFILEIDNKPLSQILSPTKGLPTLTATRMQHYAIFLEAFDYTPRCKKSKELANADGFSRNPINKCGEINVDEIHMVEEEIISQTPLNAKELGVLTSKDSKVKNLIQGLRNGIQVNSTDRFNVNQSEYSLHEDCLLRGIRVYIPEKARMRVLAELHSAHFGASRMKALARGYCWWEGIDKEIENLVKNCTACQSTLSDPPKAPVHEWPSVSEPFERVHVDFAGLFMDSYFIFIVDAYSKWIDVKIIPNITTSTTIKVLTELFSNFGWPSTLVSDRGVQFTSAEFKKFVDSHGINHLMGAPYNPITNGQCERYVATIKNKLKAVCKNKATMHADLCNILMYYRKTIHPATGKSPSVAVFNRQIKSNLDLILPKSSNKPNFIEKKVRELEISNRVSSRDYCTKDVKWKFGNIVEKLGKLHYLIKLDDGRIWKRHINQIRLVGEDVGKSENEKLELIPYSRVNSKTPTHSRFTTNGENLDGSDTEFGENLTNLSAPNFDVVDVSSEEENQENSQEFRRSNRNRREPERYGSRLP